jgi:hypothetical protein
MSPGPHTGPGTGTETPDTDPGPWNVEGDLGTMTIMSIGQEPELVPGHLPDLTEGMTIMRKGTEGLAQDLQ